MNQRKPEGARTGGRRKSEKRQRQKFVGVRFNSAEYAALTEAMARTGKPAGQLLRETFLVAYDARLLADLAGEVQSR